MGSNGSRQLNENPTLVTNSVLAVEFLMFIVRSFGWRWYSRKAAVTCTFAPIWKLLSANGDNENIILFVVLPRATEWRALWTGLIEFDGLETKRSAAEISWPTRRIGWIRWRWACRFIWIGLFCGDKGQSTRFTTLNTSSHNCWPLKKVSKWNPSNAQTTHSNGRYQDVSV